MIRKTIFKEFDLAQSSFVRYQTSAQYSFTISYNFSACDPEPRSCGSEADVGARLARPPARRSLSASSLLALGCPLSANSRHPRRLLNCLHRLCQFLVQSASLVVTELVWLQNHSKFRERAGKRDRHFTLILLQNRSSRILSHIEGFIEREANPYRPRDTTLRDLLFIHQQGCGRSLSDTATVIVEFDTDDMIAGCERLIGGNFELVIWLV